LVPSSFLHMAPLGLLTRPARVYPLRSSEGLRMAKPTQQVVATLKEFTDAVERALAKSRQRHPTSDYRANWYRGLGCADQYRLEPSLFRHPKKTNVAELLTLERDMLSDFQRQSILHPEAVHNIRDTFSTLFYLQHYGIPTRLLDWTGNPFIALYFALTSGSRRRRKEGAAVWVLDPVSWNQRALEELKWPIDRGPALPDARELSSYRPQDHYDNEVLKTMYDHPVAVLGSTNNLRLFAQKGVFTLFGKGKAAMETVYDTAEFPEGCLFRLHIPNDRITPLLEALIGIGYTDSVTYPDLQGLALEIKRLRGFAI
jgi:FRG domain-containing protein